MSDLQTSINSLLDKTKADIDALLVGTRPANDAHLPLGASKTPQKTFDKRLKLDAVLTATGLTPSPATGFDLRATQLPQGYDDYGNNSVGNCVEAAMMHYVQQATNYRGRLIYPPHNCGLIAYKEITGWNGTGIGGGTDPFAAMSYWRKTGLPIGFYQPPQITNPDGTKTTPPPIVQSRDKIKAYLWIDPANVQLFKDATYNFIGSFLTLNMPRAWQGSAVWDAPPAGLTPAQMAPWAIDSWGGHWVLVVAVIPQGVLVNSWGHFKIITWAGFNYVGMPPPQTLDYRYVGQACVPLSSMVLDQQTGLAPDGLDMAALDVWLLANGGTDSQ